MVEWLDFYNRRNGNAVISKENAYFGIYNNEMFAMVNEVLRFQTEVLTVMDIKMIFEQHVSQKNPLLSSIYMTKVLKVVNRQHRDGFILLH